jgi:hypothetical protein
MRATRLAFGEGRLTVHAKPRVRSCFSFRLAAQRNGYKLPVTKKEPHDGTHHAALKTASISYTKPSVASVGSSIADVIANPLLAW